MIRQSQIIAENENCKITLDIKFDDKLKPASTIGLCARLTNRTFEQLMEWFNANELKVVSYSKEIKGKQNEKR